MEILFNKDNHFKDTIELFPLEKSESNYLKSLIKDNYIDINLNVEFLRIGNRNINSQNYKIGDKYLKIIQNIENKEYVKSFPKIVKQLRDFDIPCSSFISSKENKEIIEKRTKENKIYFYIQEFISDSFFSGTKNELVQVILILKKLHNLRLNIENKNPSKPYSNWVPSQTLNKIKIIIKEIQAPTDFDYIANECVSIIEQVSNNYKKQIENLTKNFEEYAHFDIHPHNILFKDGKLKSIIDLESFVNVRSILATSFGIFKLSRKCFAKKSIKKNEFHNLIKNDFNIDDLKAYSQIELCRRMFLIIELHYLKSNNEWDFDLIKHFNGIKESSYIFSK
jgi:hypothetical protein